MIITESNSIWPESKVGCIFPMVISSDFPMAQHRDDDHQEDVAHFIRGQKVKIRANNPITNEYRKVCFQVLPLHALRMFYYTYHMYIFLRVYSYDSLAPLVSKMFFCNLLSGTHGVFFRSDFFGVEAF